MNAHLTIGEVLKPHGVHGEIKILPMTPDIGRFRGMKKLCLQRGDDVEEYEIARMRLEQNQAVYVCLRGVEDRDAAEALRGARAVVPREEARPLGEDAWFIVDLIGCKVFDDHGAELGELADIYQHGAADVWVIKGERPMMVPALKRLIAEVRVEERRIVLRAGELEAVAVIEGEGEEA